MFFLLPVRYCHNPPPVPDNGGFSDWDPSALSGATLFGHRVTYGCGSSRRLFDEDAGELYDQATIECMWDNTWDPPGEVFLS